MSLIDALLQEAPHTDVYIALRSGHESGSGTTDDPWNGALALAFL